MICGIEITKEDMVCITSAVGAMAIALCQEAKNEDDMAEALRLARLHRKLIKVCSAIKQADDDAK